MTETAKWLAENGVGGPVDYLAHGRLLTQRKAEADDHRAEVAEARRRAQLEEDRDARLTAMYLNGVQQGGTLARSLAIADVEAEIGGLQESIDKLSRKRDRLVSEARNQAEAVARAAAVTGDRVPADGIEGAAQRAQQALREEASWRRAEATVARRSVSRGKAAGGAAARRSEYCVHCIEQGVDDETSILLHSDPELAVPTSTAEQAAQAEVDDLIAEGFSRATAKLAQKEISR